MRMIEKHYEIVIAPKTELRTAPISAIASTVLLLFGVCLLFVRLTGLTEQMARVDRSAEVKAKYIFRQK